MEDQPFVRSLVLFVTCSMLAGNLMSNRSATFPRGLAAAGHIVHFLMLSHFASALT